LGDIVTDTCENPVRIFARKLLGIGRAILGRPIEVTGNGDRRHRDGPAGREDALDAFGPNANRPIR
jgi:hypothetical protein